MFYVLVLRVRRILLLHVMAWLFADWSTHTNRFNRSPRIPSVGVLDRNVETVVPTTLFAHRLEVAPSLSPAGAPSPTCRVYLRGCAVSRSDTLAVPLAGGRFASKYACVVSPPPPSPAFDNPIV